MHVFDQTRLSDYLAANVPGFSGLKAIEKFKDGQSNPTYKLTDQAGQDFVLRAKPPGKLLKSAHAVDREFRVMSALKNSAVPVPQMLHLSGDETPLGAQFFVMEYVDGDVFWDPAFPGQSNEFRTAAYDAQIWVLAALHSIDPASIGLSDYGKPGNYFARQLARWSDQYKASETETVADMDWVMDWLNENLVADDGQVAIVHGDYRLDNLMFVKGAPKVAAVMDWELSTLGHPFADLAYHCMGLRLPQTALIKGLLGVDRASLGIPDETDYVAQYCAQRGIEPPDNWPFYMAFSFFRLAAILQGVLHRAKSGNASNPAGMGAMAANVQALAAMAKLTATGG